MNLKTILTPALAALCGIGLQPGACASPHTITLEALSSVSTAPRNNGATPPVLSPPGAALVVVHDPVLQRLLVVNQAKARIDIFGIANPSAPITLPGLDMSSYGTLVTSVAIKDDLLAVAMTGTKVTDPGSVVFFNHALEHLQTVTVGALPDMITFTPSGRYLLAGNEGEPADDYTVDPAGSITRIDVLHEWDVTTIGFESFNDQAAHLRAQGVHLVGPNASVAQDLEPEYIAVSKNSDVAWVTLQENNAVAIVNINEAKVTNIVGLGTKDHSLAANAFDASDRDSAKGTGSINIRTWPVRALYQPDGIASLRIAGNDYLVIANEGSARDAAGPGNEAARLGTLTLDPVLFPDAASLKLNAQLGRLNVSKFAGDTDGDGDIDVIKTFGGRSFSILSASGQMLWDSGSQFESIIAAQEPLFFNSANTANNFDDRSDDKGPEPEGVAVGKAFGKYYAFIGLERVSGVMVYDISTPTAPVFVEYVNNRDFTVAPALPAAGDLGSEGLTFIKAEDSPNGSPLLVVANEVSGTTTLYELVKK
ncbi:MAG TPA: choice-of-anchor I family protein [Verrucomicrobiales bacterium]|nr:choice-of-anchor I family protein [Verrucomicrobiales bacterium]